MKALFDTQTRVHDRWCCGRRVCRIQRSYWRLALRYGRFVVVLDEGQQLADFLLLCHLFDCRRAVQHSLQWIRVSEALWNTHGVGENTLQFFDTFS